MTKPDLEVYFDGSCGPGNPGGTAAFGVVVYDADRNVIHEESGRVGTGPQMSNNVGEYAGLIKAMMYVATEHPDKRVLFRGDSSLVIEQMNGRSRARKGLYIPYHKSAIEIAKPFIASGLWQFEWIPRDMNSEADNLSQYQRYEPYAP